MRVHVDGERHDGAAYLGTRPTFDDGAPMLEVFLLDFDGDLYGREIEVEFIDFIRGDRRFDGMEALKAQMALDCDARPQDPGGAACPPSRFEPEWAHVRWSGCPICMASPSLFTYPMLA